LTCGVATEGTSEREEVSRRRTLSRLTWGQSLLPDCEARKMRPSLNTGEVWWFQRGREGAEEEEEEEEFFHNLNC
jgi:hypothetical protein